MKLTLNARKVTVYGWQNPFTDVPTFSISFTDLKDIIGWGIFALLKNPRKQNCSHCFYIAFPGMAFFSEFYHLSIQKVPKKGSVSKVLHWEQQKIADRRYSGCNRLDVHSGEIPPFGYESFDGMNSVGVYVVLRGRKLPDGIYAYDPDGKSGAPDVVGQLVRIGGKDEMKRLAEAFPDKDFLLDTPVLYLFTGLLERSVWRFKEGAYARVLQDVGACVGSFMLHAKSGGALGGNGSAGGKVFPLGGFVDDQVAVVLNLPSTEVPLAALAVFPEYSEVAYDSVDDGVGESAYSNRSEADPLLMAADPGTIYDAGRYPSRFMRQNRYESIEDLSKCIRVRRLATQALPGDEFPLTPARYDGNLYNKVLCDLKKEPKRRPVFKRVSFDLDEFSSMLRWLEQGKINLFGAGLLKIWIVVFDVMFVFPGVYRYVPVRKSIYMQGGEVAAKKFLKCHTVAEDAENAAFAVVLTADLNEACCLLGERSYRYLNMNAGYIAQSLNLSGRILQKTTRSGFYYQDDLRKLCRIPENESIISEILVGK